MSKELEVAQNAFLADMQCEDGAMSEEEISAVMDKLDIPDKIRLMKFIADYYTNVLEPSLQTASASKAGGTKH